MSTKLYEGLRLKQRSPNLFDVVRTVSAAISQKYAQAAVNLLLDEVAKVVDAHPTRFSEKDQTRMVMTLAEEKWQKDQVSYGPNGALNDPLRFNIVFGLDKSGRVLAYPYYREQRYRTALEETGLFEDYHYQNNTDRPEDVTEFEWDQRRQNWDSILSPQGTLENLPHWTLNTTYANPIFTAAIDYCKPPKGHASNDLVDEITIESTSGARRCRRNFIDRLVAQVDCDSIEPGRWVGVFLMAEEFTRGFDFKELAEHFNYQPLTPDVVRSDLGDAPRVDYVKMDAYIRERVLEGFVLRLLEAGVAVSGVRGE